MPRKKPDEFKTAFIKTFDSLEPFTAEFPTKELEYPNIQKVTFLSNEPNIEYYLEGNDIVICGISQVTLEKKGSAIEISVRK